jgi:hypothetical protein
MIHMCLLKPPSAGGGREVNRVQGVLEQVNIKPVAVATHIVGVCGRAILASVAELAKGWMRTKIPLVEQD